MHADGAHTIKPSAGDWLDFADRSLSLLLVDDDPSAVEALGNMISGLGQVRFALNAQEALALARKQAPDLILADQEMPGGDGLSLIATLQSDPRLATIPVVLVTSHTDVANEVAGFAAGACDFIRKPAVPEVVLARATMQLRIKVMSDRLRALAGTDALTGLANRRQYNQTLNLECQRARRSGQPLALLVIDIDYFKKYNDQFGHLQGDRCLVGVSTAITSALQRSTDFAARWGGEEFAVLLPMTDQEGALAVAHRVIQQLTSLALQHPQGIEGRVTVSIGVAVAQPNTVNSVVLDPTALLATADRRLYQAKRNGRNQVVNRDLAGAPTQSKSAAVHSPVPAEETPPASLPVAEQVPGAVATTNGPAPAKTCPLPANQAEQPSPPASTPWPPIEGVDLSEAQTRLGGSLDLFSRMIHRLCDDATAVMDQGLPPSQDLAALLHKIAGTAGFVGANDLNRASLEAERALRQGGSDANERVQQALQLLRNLRASALKILSPPNLAPTSPVVTTPPTAAPTPSAATPLDLAPLRELLLEQDLQARRLADQLGIGLRQHLGETAYGAFLAALNRLDYPAAARLLGP